MDIQLFSTTEYGVERLQEISLPAEQLRHVRFSVAAAHYEAAGNPWSFAVDCDGRCVGYLNAERDFEGDFHIHKFVVDSRYQGQGIGTEAMNQFLRLARSAQAEYIFLSVAFDNREAERFYRKFGFSETELGLAEAGCRLFSLAL